MADGTAMKGSQLDQISMIRQIYFQFFPFFDHIKSFLPLKIKLYVQDSGPISQFAETGDKRDDYNCKNESRLWRICPVDELLHVVLEPGVTREPEDLEVGLAAAEGHGGPGERVKAEITGSNTALRIKIRLSLLNIPGLWGSSVFWSLESKFISFLVLDLDGKLLAKILQFYHSDF